MKANTIIRRFGRFAACVAMLAAAACTGNFEDYNTKPFRPSDDDLNGDNVGVGILFPAMMEFVTHFQVNASQMRRACGRRTGRLHLCREVLPRTEHRYLQSVGQIQRLYFRADIRQFLRQLLQGRDPDWRRGARLPAGPYPARGGHAARDRRLRSDSLFEDAERHLLGALRQPARCLHGDDRRFGCGDGDALHVRVGR